MRIKIFLINFAKISNWYLSSVNYPFVVLFKRRVLVSFIKVALGAAEDTGTWNLHGHRMIASILTSATHERHGPDLGPLYS